VTDQYSNTICSPLWRRLSGAHLGPAERDFRLLAGPAQDGRPDGGFVGQLEGKLSFPHSPKQLDTDSFRQGDYDAETVLENFFSITPILTVLFPGNGSDNLVSAQEASLTCLKAIDLTTASEETQSPDGGDSAAGRVMGSGSIAILGGLMTMGFAVLFG
jgi:hypothetical protein